MPKDSTLDPLDPYHQAEAPVKRIIDEVFDLEIKKRHQTRPRLKDDLVIIIKKTIKEIQE